MTRIEATIAYMKEYGSYPNTPDEQIAALRKMGYEPSRGDVSSGNSQMAALKAAGVVYQVRKNTPFLLTSAWMEKLAIMLADSITLADLDKTGDIKKYLINLITPGERIIAEEISRHAKQLSAEGSGAPRILAADLRVARTRQDAIKTHGNSCVFCGRGKGVHAVETAHIVQVKWWAELGLKLIDNSPFNVLVLCPNCHAEFDKGPGQEGKIDLRGGVGGFLILAPTESFHEKYVILGNPEMINRRINARRRIEETLQAGK